MPRGVAISSGLQGLYPWIVKSGHRMCVLCPHGPTKDGEMLHVSDHKLLLHFMPVSPSLFTKGFITYSHELH